VVDLVLGFVNDAIKIGGSGFGCGKRVLDCYGFGHIRATVPGFGFGLTFDFWIIEKNKMTNKNESN